MGFADHIFRLGGVYVVNSAQYVENKIAQWKQEGHTRAELTVLIAEAALGWPYVWGGYGQYCTPVNREAYASRNSCPADEAAVIRKKCQVISGGKESCSGCKYYPDGKTCFYDCRGFTRSVLEQAGCGTIQGGGATSQYNDNSNWSVKGPINEMPPGQVCCVFQYNATKNNMQHTGLHIGGGNIIHCSGEVKRGKVTDKGWTHYAVPKRLDGEQPMPVWRPTIRKGSTGDDVVYLQEILNGLGYDTGGIDGKYGEKTRKAVMEFQRINGLGVDGITGPLTWEKLQEAIGEGDVVQAKYTVTIKGLTKEQAEELKSQYADAEITKG